MSSLPPVLRPWWAVLKRGHGIVSLVVGVLTRSLSWVLGPRGVPRRAYLASADAANAEPQRITRTAGGRAYRMTRTIPVGEPADHPTFLGAREVEVPERYVLELDGGRVVGDYAALVTPGGRLDYQTSAYFGVTGWRAHPLYLRPTVGSRRHVPGRVLSLTSPGTASNFYHFLYDSIGRLEVVDASGIDRDFDAVIVPHGARYQRELLDLAGVTAPLVELRRGQSVSADRLVVPSTPNTHLVAPRDTVAWLRETLMPAGVETSASERVYITRGDTRGSRCYLQEVELWPELEARGFTRVDPGALSVREQIGVFSRAKLVVSPHGAGLSNITFAPKGTHVLEFFSASYVHLGLWAICEALGHVHYHYLVGDGPQGRTHGPRPLDDISLDPIRILDTVDRMIADHEAADPTARL